MQVKHESVLNGQVRYILYSCWWFNGRRWRWMKWWLQIVALEKVTLPFLVRRCFRLALTCQTTLNTLWACSVCRRLYQRNCSGSQKISEWLWGKDTTPLSRLSSSPANERRWREVPVWGRAYVHQVQREASVKRVHLYVLVVGGNRHKLR